MNEVEWLSTNNVAAMIEWITGSWNNGHDPLSRGSDQKLQRWVEACRRSNGGTFVVLRVTEPVDLKQAVDSWAKHIEPFKVPMAARANLLREIVNPWAPQIGIECDSCCGLGHINEGFQQPYECSRCRGKGELSPSWITPTVTSLAKAASEGVARKCPNECTLSRIGANVGRHVEYEHAGPDSRWVVCETCHGSGQLSDGTLDPTTLAVLADALEDGGCDEVEILQHLRGFERHPPCSLGYECEHCTEGKGWITKRHECVRGCWVISLLTGEG